MELWKIVFNVEMITRLKRIFKPKKLFQYSGKSICEHIDYIWNCITAFWFIFEKFQIKDFKIIFVIQTLIDELKKIWYYFEKNHFDYIHIQELLGLSTKFFQKFNELTVLFCSVFQWCKAIEKAMNTCFWCIS